MNPENAEFIALVTAAGWTPAEAARQLDLGRSSTGRFMSGKIKPSAPVLKLLKLILASENPDALTAAHELRGESLLPWARDVIEELRWLHADDRQRVIKAMRAAMAGMPRRPAPSSLKTSYAGEEKAAKLLKKASASLRKRADGPSPSSRR